MKRIHVLGPSGDDGPLCLTVAAGEPEARRNAQRGGGDLGIDWNDVGAVRCRRSGVWIGAGFTEFVFPSIDG